MSPVLANAMDDFSHIFGTLISLDDANRGWRHFWANNELRYREGERDPNCPPNTYRTSIPRKMPARQNLDFTNEQNRAT